MVYSFQFTAKHRVTTFYGSFNFHILAVTVFQLAPIYAQTAEHFPSFFLLLSLSLSLFLEIT